MKRHGFALLVLFLLGSPAFASPLDDLAQILKDTAASPTQSLTFFRGLTTLQDCELEGAPLTDAIANSGVPFGGVLGMFLRNLERLEKRGAKLWLVSSEGVVDDSIGGVFKLKKKVRFELSSSGPRQVKLSSIRGGKVGKIGTSVLFPLRWLEFTVDSANVTTARINAGYPLGANVTTEKVLQRAGASGALAASGS